MTATAGVSAGRCALAKARFAAPTKARSSSGKRRRRTTVAETANAERVRQDVLPVREPVAGGGDDGERREEHVDGPGRDAGEHAPTLLRAGGRRLLREDDLALRLTAGHDLAITLTGMPTLAKLYVQRATVIRLPDAAVRRRDRPGRPRARGTRSRRRTGAPTEATRGTASTTSAGSSRRRGSRPAASASTGLPVETAIVRTTLLLLISSATWRSSRTSARLPAPPC